MPRTAKPKYTHFRVKFGPMSLGGDLRKAGDVVEIANASFRDETLQALHRVIADTGNTYRVLEAGTVEDGAFVPFTEPGKAEASPGQG
jgi:hypothetical protein